MLFQQIGDRDVCCQTVADAEITVQQIDDLRLNGSVQRGDAFIRDDEPGLHDQCPCDADALPLSAGKFVRVLIHTALRLGDADLAQRMDLAAD